MNLYGVLRKKWTIIFGALFIICNFILINLFSGSDYEEYSAQDSDNATFWHHFTYKDPRNYITTNVIVHRFYLDDRSQVNINARAFFILDRKYDFKPVCQLYFRHKSIQVSASVQPIIIMPFVANNVTYYTYLVKCPITSYWTLSKTYYWTLRRTLEYVSIHGTEESEKIPVVIPKKRTDGVADSIALCLAPQYGTFTDKLYAPFIVQWVELLQMLGVSKISWYNATMNSDGIYVNEVLKYYSNNGIINLVQMPIPVKYNKHDDFHTHIIPTAEAQAIEVTRLAIINDCYYRDIHKHWYFIHTDKDEIIIPHKSSGTYQSYLKSFFKNQGNEIEKTEFIHHHSLAVTSSFFYLTNNKNRADVPDYLPMLKYTYRQPTEPTIHNPGYSKSFINPRTCESFWNHACCNGPPKYLPENEIQVHHYRYKCFEGIAGIRHNGQNCSSEKERHFEDTSIEDLYGDALRKRTMDVLKMVNFY